MSVRDSDWYFKATNELLQNKDTEDARAVLDETRTELRSGQDPKVVIGVLKAKGARNNAPGVVNRAFKLELPGLMHTASDDLAAGRGDTPHMVRAKTYASSLLIEDPSGATLSAQLTSVGASDALAAHLVADPHLRRKGHEQAWLFLGVGALLAIGAVWYYTSTPPSDLPYGAGVLGAVAVLALWYGIKGLNRK